MGWDRQVTEFNDVEGREYGDPKKWSKFHTDDITCICLEDIIHEIYTVGPNFAAVNEFLCAFMVSLDFINVFLYHINPFVYYCSCQVPAMAGKRRWLFPLSVAANMEIVAMASMI